MVEKAPRKLTDILNILSHSVNGGCTQHSIELCQALHSRQLNRFSWLQWQNCCSKDQRKNVICQNL